MRRVAGFLLACLMVLGTLLPGGRISAADAHTFSFKGATKIQNGGTGTDYLITLKPGDQLSIRGNVLFDGDALGDDSYYFIGPFMGKRVSSGKYEMGGDGSASSVVSMSFEDRSLKALQSGVVGIAFNARENTYGFDLWIEVREGADSASPRENTSQKKKITVKINEKGKKQSMDFCKDILLKSSSYDLAKLSALAASATYAGKDAVLGLLKDCGFEKDSVESIFSGKYSLNAKEKCRDASMASCNHHCTIYTGRQTVNGQTVIAVIISGYSSGGNEWVSNFEIGNEKYRKKNGDYHQGFYEAAREVLNMVRQKYAGDLSGTAGKPIFWLAGHSRGAAVMNLVAADLTEQYGKKQVVAYGFATPNVADKKLVHTDYTNIINLVNKGDFVPFVPPSAWGYRKNGKTLAFSMSIQAKKYYKKYKGISYTGTSSTERKILIAAFQKAGGSKKLYYKKIIAGMYTPASYCKKGLAVLVRGKGDDVWNGAIYMFRMGQLSLDVTALNAILLGEEGGEIVSASFDKGRVRILESLVEPLLSAHRMEAYLAYVNSSAGKKALR